MRRLPVQIPAPHVIEEIEKRRIPEEGVPLQLPLPVPLFPEPSKKKEEKEQRVIVIQL